MAKKDPKREFKGVFIPKAIWLSTEMSLVEKAFLVEIDSLSIKEKGCFASNDHFRNLFGLSLRQVSRIIAQLSQKELIKIEKTSEKTNRKCKRILIPVWTKMSTHTIDKNVCPDRTKMATHHRQKCPTPMTKMATPYIRKNIINTNTNEYTQENKGNTKDIPEKALELALKKIKNEAGKYDLALFKIIPARHKGERTTFNRLREYLIAEVAADRQPIDIFASAIAWATEAKIVDDNPRRLYVAKCKQVTGFTGKGAAGRLLSGIGDFAGKVRKSLSQQKAELLQTEANQ